MQSELLKHENTANLLRKHEKDSSKTWEICVSCDIINILVRPSTKRRAQILQGAIKETINGTRKTQIETRVHPPLRRLRDRHRKCVEVPLYMAGQAAAARLCCSTCCSSSFWVRPSRPWSSPWAVPAMSPVRAYQALEKPGQKWHIHGYFTLIGCYLADDVLHHGGRLDAPLHLHDRCR